MHKTWMTYWLLVGLGLLVFIVAGCPVNHPPAGGSATTGAVPVVSDGQDHLKWWDSMDRARHEATDFKLPMVVDVGADWCGWCKKLAAESFPDPAVQALKDQFVWVRVDADKDQATAEKYRITGLPTVLVVDASGKEISRLEGYKPGPDLAAFLKQALNRVIK
jgi:thiol:disulfide interchange protein